MAGLWVRRRQLALLAKRSLPTSLQIRHHDAEDLTLLELTGGTNLRNCTPEEYRSLRELYISYERYAAVGNDIQLTLKERDANELIMCEKKREYEKGIMDPTKFTPGYHFFEVVLHKIKKSPLFHMLRKMPKGGALMVLDTSICSVDYVISLTYRENLWVCTKDNGCNVVEFRFSQDKPKVAQEPDCEWQPMEKLREYRGEENLKKYLRVRLSMFPLSSFRTNDHAWDHLMEIFTLVKGLLHYADVWGDYFYNALEEFYADGVQYLEVRSMVPKLYCLDGSLLPERITIKIYKETLERFKKDNPGFIGCNLIYAPFRHITPEELTKHIDICTELNKEYPGFVVGFDLVGQEDRDHPLSGFVEQLLKLPDNINFFFHAGQTNWYGSHVDANLVDAILLGTRRISHGYTITKHPLLMRMAKYLNIAIEVCPVSNQVLQLGSDYRNHPAATLIAENVPMVISSANPAFWRANPLSHDIYMAFLGIAPMNADLKFLKRTAKNSLRYSSLKDEAKAAGMEKWKKEWDEWIDAIVEEKNKDKGEYCSERNKD
ncbi:hypothetical protein KR009_008658, partial [Drosophila setifemur]